MVTQRQSFNYAHPYIVQGVSNAHCAIRSMVQRFSCINDVVLLTVPFLMCGHRNLEKMRFMRIRHQIETDIKNAESSMMIELQFGGQAAFVFIAELMIEV